jgi:transposase
LIQVTPQMRILVAVEPVDFRKGIDGLARIAKDVLARDAYSGSVFVFRNRRATAIKLLVYDGQGFWLCLKRLSSGRFRFWPRETRADEKGRSLLAHELAVLLSGGDFEAAKSSPQWRRVSPSDDLVRG